MNASVKINDNLQEMITEITKLLEKSDVLEEQLDHLLNKNYYDEIQDKIIHKKGELPNKQFMSRNSLLTDLLEIKHIQTIYHMFVAILFGLFVNSTVYDLIHTGQTKMGFALIIKEFANIRSALYIWIGMFLSTCCTYVIFSLWATVRTQLFPKSLQQRLWDKMFVVLYINYILMFVYLFTTSIISYNLTISESTAMLCEITRLIMKTHAFIRSNAPAVLNYKPHAENELYYPEFSNFLYFLFVPTLIYKDNYPRTKSIHWKYVAKCFFEVLGCIFYISFIIERFLSVDFQNIGLKPICWKEVVLAILGNGMAGILVLLTTFYAVLHSWMNGVAEMLKFGDRMFYKDWWTSSTYGRYYRTWNVIVHDWLYTYVYKDMYEVVVPKNKSIAKLMVFFFSAIVHEYILGFAFRFCLPILFILFFGFGVVLYFFSPNNKWFGNVFVWYGLALGMGIGISFYTMEFYMRLNCPIEQKSVINYFIPRLFTCV
ncbi:hypothetical protein RN001_004414 [Aquatica leii]|uniref:O-acyltransferase n=1 Tax=Aquatica leii TaxID=1421715 RepID=A0AAN7P5B9_9COLE|nr:hypothetical protein RN001_004414 [Aquatica leii]